MKTQSEVRNQKKEAGKRFFLVFQTPYSIKPENKASEYEFNPKKLFLRVENLTNAEKRLINKLKEGNRILRLKTATEVIISEITREVNREFKKKTKKTSFLLLRPKITIISEKRIDFSQKGKSLISAYPNETKEYAEIPILENKGFPHSIKFNLTPRFGRNAKVSGEYTRLPSYKILIRKTQKEIEKSLEEYVEVSEAEKHATNTSVIQLTVFNHILKTLQYIYLPSWKIETVFSQNGIAGFKTILHTEKPIHSVVRFPDVETKKLFFSDWCRSKGKTKKEAIAYLDSVIPIPKRRRLVRGFTKLQIPFWLFSTQFTTQKFIRKQNATLIYLRDFSRQSRQLHKKPRDTRKAFRVGKRKTVFKVAWRLPTHKFTILSDFRNTLDKNSYIQFSLKAYRDKSEFKKEFQEALQLIKDLHNRKYTPKLKKITNFLMILY